MDPHSIVEVYRPRYKFEEPQFVVVRVEPSQDAADSSDLQRNAS